MEEIAITLQKDLPTCLTSSFLTVYLQLFLNETSDVNSKCIEFVIRNTDNSLHKLLHSDIKVILDVVQREEMGRKNKLFINRELLLKFSSTTIKIQKM